MDRARIGSCANLGEAALIRAAFEAHSIPVVISGEQHGYALGGLGGPMISLDILVPADRADEASALLRDLRVEHESDDEPDSEVDAPGDDIVMTVARRRKVGIVLLLGCCVTFGTAHLAVGKWGRALGLLACEIYAIAMVTHRTPGGALVLLACIATDVVGALVVLGRRRPPVPHARVHRRERPERRDHSELQ